MDKINNDKMSYFFNFAQIFNDKMSFCKIKLIYHVLKFIC